jgi:hypothetical protein
MRRPAVTLAALLAMPLPAAFVLFVAHWFGGPYALHLFAGALVVAGVGGGLASLALPAILYLQRRRVQGWQWTLAASALNAPGLLIAVLYVASVAQMGLL